MRRVAARINTMATLWVAGLLLLAVSIVALMFLREWRFNEFAVFFCIAAGIYGAAAWHLFDGRSHAGVSEKNVLAAILVIAALLRVVALFAPQALSTDAFRYIWDGRVQSAGINPYRYVPADEALRSLRDATIYPNINRADYAHTIYPPTAQMSFLAITTFSKGIVGMKIGMLLFDSVAIACLIALLRRSGLPATRVLLYAWHPLPVWEFAGTGHVDAIAIALLLIAFLSASRRAPIAVGVALAAATLVKYYPVIAAPVLYKRWDWRMPLAFIITLLLLYAPYLNAGRSVLGFLSGYAAEEGLRDGSGIFLWSLLATVFHLPSDALRYYAPFVALVVIAFGVWLQIARRSTVPYDMSATLLMAGAFTLLVSPHDPWYFTWLIPFLCFRVSIAHLWLTVACIALYVLPNPTGLRAQAVLYGPFLLLLGIQYFIERRPSLPENVDANRNHRPLRA